MFYEHPIPRVDPAASSGGGRLLPINDLDGKRLAQGLRHQVQRFQRLVVVVVDAAVVAGEHVDDEVTEEPGAVVLPQPELVPEAWSSRIGRPAASASSRRCAARSRASNTRRAYS